ncbi:BAR-domain-containing protein [Ceraceosorus guamensis]|uniref:BAR-domain-containing protein n=1 Tax=Ceraceosorus guamensis TaxID=1522189 RepID=A0A316VXK7_9BASI|nr:BAR-domain-containing protein [Ceraceosorus guamensis]PWN42356.1 BAR-domain-containing protein [Ceraceosorus guamensis]
MKGALKFAKRTPHLLQGKVGMAAKSHDAAFDELNRKFGQFEKNADHLHKDATAMKDGVKNMLLSGAGFGSAFANLFANASNRSAYPKAEQTAAYLPIYDAMMEELRETLTPEIELIESRIISPANEFIGICKAVRKNITKRDHKLIDYDRHNNSYTKLKDKKDKTLKDEQNLFKVEQDFETAAADYEYFNNNLKEELPRFFEMAQRFITPIFHSFYYMQLNVYYLTLDKLQTFADGKYDIAKTSGISIEDTYVQQLNDAAERLEALTIRKPTPPSARVLQQARSGSSPASPPASRYAPPPKAAPTHNRVASASTASAAAPPAYTAGASSATSSAAAGKRAPPPPPTKPKPGAAPGVTYVTALYDYTAQADGDLSFSTGDRIEVVERTASTEDWWTGKVHGVQGVFPGNYVREG